METPIKRGSIWRKWDLHVHSPASDGYSGTWEQFYEQLRQAECSVIGINDYFSIEGYATVKEKVDSGNLDLEGKVILPVVEFRMRDVLQNRHTFGSGVNINFHVIYDPNIELEKIRTFIKGLSIDGDTQIANRYNDKQFLKEQAKVYFQDVIKELRNNNDFNGKFLVWLPYDEYGGIGDIDPVTDDWIKRGFIRKSHILGSANQKQISFFLWNSPVDNDGNKKFSEDEFREWFKVKKPCIKGSDSHSHNYPIGKLRDEDSNPIDKFCWIKADTTFEGLKQIVYEPESRVCIGKDNPNNYSHSSIDTLIIDKDDITRKSSGRDRFFINEGEEIYFNHGFTTVIGSRGAGKSVLLDTLSLSLGGLKVVAKASYVEDIVDEYSDDAILLSSKIKGGRQGTPVSYNWPKVNMGDAYNFEYFSQKEIGEIADFRNEEDKQRLSQLIYDYVFSDYAREALSERIKLKEDILQKLEANRIDILKKQKTIDKKSSIESRIQELEKEKEAYSQEELSDLYERREDFRNLKSEMEKSSGGISEKLGKFDQLMDDYSGELFIEDEENDELNYDGIKENLLNLYVPEQLFKDDQDYDSNKQEFSTKLEELFSGLKSTLENHRKYLENFSTLLTNQMTELGIDQKLENITQKLREKCEELGIEFNKEIDEKRQQIEKQLNRLEEQAEKIEKAEKEKEKLLETREKIIEKYHGKLDEIQASLEGAFEEFCENEGKVLEGSISIEFYKLNMIDECIELIEDIVKNDVETQDRNFPRKNLHTILSEIDLSTFIECLRSTGFRDIGLKEFKDIGEGTIKFLEGIINGEEIALSLEEQLTSLEATIKWRGEHDQNHKPLSKCSVGEKSTAVLSIMLVSGKVPLIIDQPEEDLDNYYIWNQLAPIIKEVKNRRQLIFATHNANIVVGGDAELILILDSSGGNSTNITPTTLEDMSTRKNVINILEGGESAFDKRRKKYGIY